ncbi:DNA-binding protein [Bacteroidaceae bacterium HV4-6-C5C]|nr:DNA-binding protein [Bacteroidaceae bacterium HV4-6-C5C]
MKVNGYHRFSWVGIIRFFQTTREVADQLSVLSTVTRGDTYAVMENLGQVLSSYMGQGRTVKIDGVGTFYYTASANKHGVAKAEDVTASLIKGVRVRFIPEVGRNSGGKVATRSMVDTNIIWEEWGKTTASSDNGGNGDNGNTGGNGSGSGDGKDDDPLG